MKKDTDPTPITAAQLADAHAAARLSIPLDDAMRSPVLARCLEITAEVLVADPDLLIDRSYQYRQWVAPPVREVGDNPPARDIKRAAAGDEDD